MSRRPCEPLKSQDAVSLKEYFDSRLDEFERDRDEQNRSMDKRLETMNEFRASLKDQQANFLTKNEYEQRHQNLEDKIEALQKIVYMGMGAILVIEFVFKFFTK